jgi:tagaturonate reductase
MITPILQFGTSRLLQAHADLFVSQAMDQGEALGPITVVQTTQSTERNRRLAALAAPDGFPVRIRGLQNGAVLDDMVQVRSVKRGLSAHENWRDLERVFVDEAQVVICNTADKGYDCSTEGAVAGDPPSSFPGKLTRLLSARFRHNGNPLTILPTELISRNGEALKAAVLSMSSLWSLPRDFTDWLGDAVIFSNTLVDRIVSEPLEPAGAVAEPYALWAIERQAKQVLPCPHADIVVADDISTYERLKLFILNLGHTALTDAWLGSDLPRDMVVRDLLGIPAFAEALLKLYDTEIVPGFAAMGMKDEAEIYVRKTMERFSNPFLDHRLSDIAQNHVEKIRRRAGGFLQWTETPGPCLEKLMTKIN